MSYVTTKDNVEIYYAGHRQGPAIAFVSGYMGIADIWHHQIDALSGKYRCITHDNRGYGRSDKPESVESYSVALHAEDLKDVLYAAGVQGPVVLVTHSMGCDISTEFALKYPNQVAGIIYTGTYLSSAQFRRMGVTGDTLYECVSTPSASIQFFTAFGLEPQITQEAAKWARHSLHGNAQAPSSNDCGQRYSEIKVPALIIQGGSDVITPVDPCATALQPTINGAQLAVLEGVNHFPQTEAPEKVFALIDSFMRSQVVQ